MQTYYSHYIPAYHYRMLPTIRPFERMYLPPLTQAGAANPFGGGGFGTPFGGMSAGGFSPADLMNLASQFMRSFFNQAPQPGANPPVARGQLKTSSIIKHAKIHKDLPTVHPILLGALLGSLFGAGYMGLSRSKKKETSLPADLIYGGLLGGLGGGSAGLALSQALEFMHG